MNVNEILAALRQEREWLNEAILCFERIDQSRDKIKKLGRPLGSKNKPKILPLAVLLGDKNLQ